jgi:hypothetical protein
VETHGSGTRLIEQQLRSDESGEPEAAERQIWERYFHALLGLARHHLSRRLRRREDEEDVVQSMYKRSCVGQQRGDFNASRTAKKRLRDISTAIWAAPSSRTLTSAISRRFDPRSSGGDIGVSSFFS